MYGKFTKEKVRPKQSYCSMVSQWVQAIPISARASAPLLRDFSFTCGEEASRSWVFPPRLALTLTRAYGIARVDAQAECPGRFVQPKDIHRGRGPSKYRPVRVRSGRSPVHCAWLTSVLRPAPLTPHESYNPRALTPPLPTHTGDPPRPLASLDATRWVIGACYGVGK